MSDHLPKKCKFPDLPEKYDKALREAVEFILNRFDPCGIIVSGTIIRGNPAPTSDLDIYVIHSESFRQRIQKFFNGIPAEIFVNPPSAIEGYFRDEGAEGRPVTAHLLSTGFVILDLDPVVEDLQNKASRFLAKSPSYSDAALTNARYMTATLYEDAIDILGKDPAAANMLLSRAVYEMLHYLFKRSAKFIPRGKDLLNAVAIIDPDIAKMARKFFQTSDLEKRCKLAGQIADGTIGERGFFEWESEIESVS